MIPPGARRAARVVAAAAFATVTALLVYATVQQTYRTGANDPQIQIADDTAVALRAGADPVALTTGVPVDMASGLRPFVIVYDARNQPVAGSGLLDGRVPTPPPGVLTIARRYGWHGVTWEPRPGVRVASVLRAVDGAAGRVVLAGRSLREVELRTSRLILMVCVAWGALLATGVIAALL